MQETCCLLSDRERAMLRYMLDVMARPETTPLNQRLILLRVLDAPEYQAALRGLLQKVAQLPAPEIPLPEWARGGKLLEEERHDTHSLLS